jgi:hypothetical protein
MWLNNKPIPVVQRYICHASMFLAGIQKSKTESNRRHFLPAKNMLA